MKIFFAHRLNSNDSSITLDPEESHHAIKSLRSKKNEKVFLLNGKGERFTVEIVNPDPRGCVLKIINYEKQPLPKPQIHIALAQLKQRERVEWWVEKAIELGVSELSFFISEHTEKKSLSAERLQRIAISALKQSGNLWLPKISVGIHFQSLISETIEGQKLIAYCETGNEQSLKNVYRPGSNALILIGPEGDFSSEEVDAAQVKGFLPVNLGPLRLRAETAALYALLTCKILSEEG
jgi:16S rRNA (uracil1498-N3)-methyltransferase